jgi:SAM-dependent methyltransferase
MAIRLSESELSALLCCPGPTCRAPLTLADAPAVVCLACGESFRRLVHTVDFTPSRSRQELARWPAWEQLQHNGLVSYEQAPDKNLAVGPRPDCLAFSQFCHLTGLVLDIGCGPQPWPAYFAVHDRQTCFVGIDPLAPDAPSEFVRLRGLGEYLPFRDGIFERVLFSTSLDHMLDTTAVLREARRVCKPGGQVVIWSGEKKAGAPRPEHSPAWYRQLVIPAGAEDPFHFKRFSEEELQAMIRSAGLKVQQHEGHVVDPWRTNHFYRVAA